MERSLDQAARRLLNSTGELARMARSQIEMEQQHERTIEAMRVLDQRLVEVENQPAATPEAVESYLSGIRAQLEEVANGQKQLMGEKDAAVQLWKLLKQQQQQQHAEQARFREWSETTTQRLATIEAELARQARIQHEDQQ